MMIDRRASPTAQQRTAQFAAPSPALYLSD